MLLLLISRDTALSIQIMLGLIAAVQLQSSISGWNLMGMGCYVASREAHQVGMRGGSRCVHSHLIQKSRILGDKLMLVVRDSRTTRQHIRRTLGKD